MSGCGRNRSAHQPPGSGRTAPGGRSISTAGTVIPRRAGGATPRSAGARSRPIILSGDSHAGWVNDLHDDAGRRVANAFGATAISSPSYRALLPGLGAVIEQGAPAVRYCDRDRTRYLLLPLTPASADAEFRTVSSVAEPTFTTATTTRWRVTAGTPGPMTAV